MTKDVDINDTINYKPIRRFLSTEKEKVLGKFKDELGGSIMSEFVGLRAKANAHKYYSSKDDASKCNKKKQNIKNNIKTWRDDISKKTTNQGRNDTTL